MDANGGNSEPQRELNDSGCVQDESPLKKPKDSYVGQAQLLDLSDDVLLCILKYCTPHELKALGFTCPRLGALVLERSLWTSVDARATPSGIKRMCWLLQAVHTGTKELQLCGLARNSMGCLGHVNRKEESVQSCCGGGGDNNNTNTLPGVEAAATGIVLPRPPSRRHLFRMSTPPSWLDEDCDDAPAEPAGPQEPGQQCSGPQFTVTAPALRTLKEKCPKLSSLSLDYCNINCRKTSINQFPPTLKRLSLKGSKCYNLPLDTSFLFKIHDTLKLLEYLDVSECEWLEPAALLPLSKLPVLTSLLVRDCPAMSEFVAYVSLATRYGFRKLKLMDWSGSPVGDPEVSALGWLPQLEELRLSAPCAAALTTHSHLQGDCVQAQRNCDDWEVEEPEYYRSREGLEASSPESSVEDVHEQVERMRERFAPQDQICIEVHTRPHEVTRRLNSREVRPTNEFRTLNDQPRPNDEHRNDRSSNHPPGLSYDPLWPLNPRSSSEPNPLKRKADSEDAESPNHAEAGPSQKKKLESPNESPDVKVDMQVDDSEDKVVKSDDKNLDQSDSAKNESPKSDTSQNESATKRKKLKESKIENPFENDIRKILNKPENSTSSKNEALKCESPSENSSSNGSNNDSPLNYESPSTSGAKNESPQTNESAKPGPSYRDNSSNTDNLDCHSFEINYPSSSSYSVNININNRPTEKETKRTRSAQPQDIPSPGPSRRGGTFEQFVHFRQNQEPVVVQCPRHQDREPAEPRHHILYVNLGQQRHAVYRLLPHLMFRPAGSREQLPAAADRLDAASLLTDAALFRFGRAHNDHVNYVNIGPNGPQFGGRADGGRPNTSNLRVLVATGYRGITNRSLVHLSSAAPHLRYIDFTNTGVTPEGVETFRSLRPDCEITYSEYVTSCNELEETDE